LIAARIKHVFIIYQENRSFDSVFGTFPGADGVWSAQALDRGFRQYNPVTAAWVTPFRIREADIDDAGHARPEIVAKMNGGRMDRFVAVEAQNNLRAHAKPQQASAMGELTMAHIDCDTVPYLWLYAKRFALFDRFFQGMTGPSTPGNIELIAAQTGLTQWARHPRQVVDAEAAGPGQPVLNDAFPQYGPYNKASYAAYRKRGRAFAFDQTYANVLLELQERDVIKVVNDANDVREDKAALARRGRAPVSWTWYQEGYADPADPQRSAYITHHNAPQYFGYVVQNDVMRRHLADLTRFYTDVQRNALPARGVFFIKGGYRNIMHLHPAGTDERILSKFAGDDDHPGYADSQISEALVARTVNAIARSRYWKDAAIIILWDDSEGFWDHAVPPQWERCPDGHACGDGPRVPALLISPFAKSGAIVSALSDHSSVTKFIQAVFGLPHLASLPDEKPYLPKGPRDWNGSLSDLSPAFDGARLLGQSAPLPASAALIGDDVVGSIPSPWNCAALHIAPVPPPPGVSDKPPADFLPRPFEQ
jgi:phospholipase C